MTHVKSESPAEYGGNFSLSDKDRAILDKAAKILERRLAKGVQLSSPDVVVNFLQHKLHHHDREHFAVLFLDHRHRLISYEVLFSGGISGCEVHPRIVAQRALALNASAVVLAHNHPSGQEEASSADRMITSRLVDSLDLLEIRVLDHFIIGDGTYLSFASRGWL